MFVIDYMKRLFGVRQSHSLDRVHDPDLHQLAIDTLLAKGTPFATGLAQEIDRGRRRTPEDTINVSEKSREVVQLRNKNHMMEQIRPALPGEYDEWVRGYIRSGGRSFRRRLVTTPQIWVAKSHLDVRPLYGARSLKILIPEGVCDNGGDTGHTDLYILRNGRYLCRGFHDEDAGPPVEVPIYSDTNLEE